MTMKVLLANKYFFLKGGAERVFFQERDYLKSEGVQVVDFAMTHKDNLPSPFEEHFVSNIDYYDCPNLKSKLAQGVKFIHSLEAVNKISALAAKEKPDIAHLHNIYHQLTPSIIPALKKHGAKVVMSLHDGKLICPAYLMLNQGGICTNCSDGSFWRPFATNCQKAIGRGLLFMLEAYWHKWARSYEQVDLFLTPSFFLKELVSKTLPARRIQVLRNGVELTSFEAVSDDQGYALYLGRLSREKGLETLGEAHKRVETSVPLKVVGTGPLEEKLRMHYPMVEFLGYKTGAELKNILAHCALVVIPSEWYENCSMVVLEAMAMGKPVIGSKVGGIPEQVDDGKTGLLFEMGNADDLAKKMEMLMRDCGLRRKMGEAARRKVEQEYSFAMHGETLIQIYRSLLN